MLKKATLSFILCLIVFSAIFKSASALETLNFDAGSEITRSTNLASGSEVIGTVIPSGLPIDFSVTDPSGNPILKHIRTSGELFNFTAEKTGTYTMHFKNSNSIPTHCEFEFTITGASAPKPTENTGITQGANEPIENLYILIAVIIITIVVLTVLLLRRRK